MDPVTAISLNPLKNNHLALIGGLPCSATYFAAELCRDLLSLKHGMCEVLILNELDEPTLQKIATIEHPVLFLAEVPDAGVVDAITHANFPVLLINQPFSDASRSFIEERDAKPLDTVRTMARAHIGLKALADIPRSVMLAANGSATAATLARLIAAEIGIEPTLCQSLIDERDLDRPMREVQDAHFALDRRAHSDETNELFDRLDEFYNLRGERSDAVWSVPMELLLEAVSPYLSATNSIDLLGPARCLTFGPYIYLLVGQWSATFTFFTSDNKSSNTIGIDVTADEEIKLEENFEINESGRFSITCEFKIDNSYYPFEFRTHLRRGSIGGEFKLLSLTLSKHN